MFNGLFGRKARASREQSSLLEFLLRQASPSSPSGRGAAETRVRNEISDTKV